ncbi:hypothetical protein DL89DRAFT_267999 [Linderina pennispora]|uniref:Uncharacterized protein n=1 Tax=Linderina pennispora TaxID=61395 RepID=A0A1Y1W5Z7_9FUNG|nr:uncharacterized protein DL89DRAFT_267999 [Linderina pennispora]ORX68953.1 hypothetical protein DL89DRAFT_267999 [Linderina pennispora]
MSLHWGLATTKNRFSICLLGHGGHQQQQHWSTQSAWLTTVTAATFGPTARGLMERNVNLPIALAESEFGYTRSFIARLLERARSCRLSLSTDI